VSETFETIGFFSLVAIFWIVARDEVAEVAALKRILISTAALPLRADIRQSISLLLGSLE